MSSNTREIRRRIKSVKNIGQITKAMELVSAAKMRKAQAAATASRPYSTMSSKLLEELVEKSNSLNNPLINRVLPDGEKMPAQKVLVVLITSDRGLAGAFNANIINKAVSIVKQEGAPARHASQLAGVAGRDKIDFITIGKKGTDVVRRMGLNIIATFASKDKGIGLADAKPIAEIAMEDFLKFKYEKVFVVFAEFVSTLVQKPNMTQLLPFSKTDAKNSKQVTDEFLFEPTADRVLENLVIRTIEFGVFQSLVEAAASEHSARMIAMRNANEAAGDLIDDLSLTYNQARQAGITRELSEISAAKLAMEG